MQQQHLWPKSIINMYRAQQQFHFVRVAKIVAEHINKRSNKKPMAASGPRRTKQAITYVSTAIPTSPIGRPI